MKKKDCVFCNVASDINLEKERKLFENKDFLAMLVLFPKTDGHFIVLPKNHASELNEMREKLGEFFEITYQWAEVVKKKLDAKAYILKLNNKIFEIEDSRFHVGHIHMHVVPRYKKEEVKRVLKKVSRSNLKKVKDLILDNAS